jgi:hypothetical protein
VDDRYFKFWCVPVAHIAWFYGTNIKLERTESSLRPAPHTCFRVLHVQHF